MIANEAFVAAPCALPKVAAWRSLDQDQQQQEGTIICNVLAHFVSVRLMGYLDPGAATPYDGACPCTSKILQMLCSKVVLVIVGCELLANC